MQKWFKKRPITRVILICTGLLGVLIGLFISRYKLNVASLSFVIVLPLFLLVLKRRWFSIPAILVIGLVIGGWRGTTYFSEISQYDALYGKRVTVVGVVLDDMSYDDRRQSEFHIGKVTINGNELPGRVRIRAQTGGNVTRGDTVRAAGKLNKTLGTSRQGSISYASVNILKEDNSWVEKVRSKFFGSVYSSLPEPHASLGLGFLVGVRTALPDTFTEQLAVVGLTHIVAVSGYNLTIIVQAVRRLFSKKSAYQSVLFSALLILGFLLMTGWSPSIMRAAIITGFSLIAWYYGRTFKPVLLILLGAAITGFISPLYVWGDVGWYLSFLAFTGVLILAPLILHKIYKGRRPNFIVAILVETLAAISLTAPYVALLFGKISLIAPIANILVVPLIPFNMLFVFLTGVVGIFLPVTALWLAVIPRALLSINIWAVEKLSQISNAQITVNISVWHTVVAYIVLGCLIMALWFGYRRQRQVEQVEAIDWNLV